MTLMVNQEKMTILGSSMIENYTPTVEDVERMKTFAEMKMRLNG